MNHSRSSRPNGGCDAFFNSIRCLPSSHTQAQQPPERPKSPFAPPTARPVPPLSAYAYKQAVPLVLAYLRLVVPGDVHAARSVRDLASIEVR